MTECTRFRDLFLDRMDGALDDAQMADFDSHVGSCRDCGPLWQTTVQISADATVLGDMEPPRRLAHEIAESPCRRWLGLLFTAVDREISEANLKRLLIHLENCTACQRVWTDMTLVRQVGEALKPPEYLAAICANPKVRRSRAPWVLGRRAATVAAYVLAVLTTIALGNPVTLARYDASDVVERAATSVGEEVEAAADTGRGEARVLLWRAMQWGERTADTIRNTVDRLRPGDPSTPESPDTPKEGTS